MVSLKKHGYALEIEDGKIGVILDGCEVAGLDVRSAVHVLGDDGKPVRDEEPALPVPSRPSFGRTKAPSGRKRATPSSAIRSASATM